jgi:hypothetical protein
LNVRDSPDGLRLTLGEIDREDLRSFLVDFRVFISDSEPAFLGKIFDLCQQHLTDETTRRYVADARKQWNALKRRDHIGGTVDLARATITPPLWQTLGIKLPYTPPAPQVPQRIEVSIGVKSGGKPVTWKHAMDLIINTLFHDNPELIAEWDCLSAEEQTMVEALFRFYVVEATRIILWMGQTIRGALKYGRFDAAVSGT